MLWIHISFNKDPNPDLAFQVNADPDLGFDEQTLYNFKARKKFYFFMQFLYQGLHEVQEKPSALKSEHLAL